MEDRSVEVQAVAILFFVLCWAAVVLRVYCRAWLLRSLGADDSLMVVSLVTFTGYLICILLALKFGAGKHRDDVDPDNYSAALKLIYASELLYVVTVCVIKISVGFFLLRISVRTVHIYSIRALVALTFLYGAAYFFILAFQCLPVSAFWAESPRVEGKCLNLGLMLGLTYAASCVNAVADWGFGVLPFFIVWTLSLPLRTRALAVGVLSLAAVGSAATVVRAVYIPRLVVGDDFLWLTADVALWSTVEPGVGIVAASIATLRPLWDVICGRSSLPSDDSPEVAGLAGDPHPGREQRVTSRTDDDEDDGFRQYYQQGSEDGPHHGSQVPRSRFSAPSSPEERGAEAGLWGSRHSRPGAPMLTLSWLFSPLGSRIAGSGGERPTTGDHAASPGSPGSSKAGFGLDDGSGGENQDSWRLTGMTALAGLVQDRNPSPPPPPPPPPKPAATRESIVQHQAAGLQSNVGPGEGGDGNDDEQKGGLQPPAKRATVVSFGARPDTMATVGTTDSHQAPQLLDVQAARLPVPLGHAYRHDGARTRSHAGEIIEFERRSRVPSSLFTPSLLSEPGTRPDSFVIPPHWKRDTLHKPAAASGGGLQPVESNEHEHEQPREPSLDGGHGGAWMQESQQSLHPPLTTASSGVWGAQTAQIQHQPPHTPRQSRQMRYSRADEDCLDGNDNEDDDDGDDSDGDGDGDARSEASEAPRLNWATPRVSAISFGGFGGGPRSDGRNSMAVADPCNLPPLRPQKSNASQRSGRSGGGEVGGASNDGMGRSGSFGNFRPRRMADYAAPVPNLPLRYLRKSRRERSAAAADQGEEEEDRAEELPVAAAVEAMPQPAAETAGMAQDRERARGISGNSGGDASGGIMASRIPIRKKT